MNEKRKTKKGKHKGTREGKNIIRHFALIKEEERKTLFVTARSGRCSGGIKPSG